MMPRPCLLAAVLSMLLAAPGHAGVLRIDVTASPFDGLHSRFEVIVYLDRPGELVELRLFELPDDGSEREVECWQVRDNSPQAAGGTCAGLPDDELAGGTVVVEILRSLPLARYRIGARGEDDKDTAGEPFDTRTFPATVARRLAHANRRQTPASPGLTRLDPEDVDGVSGVRRFEVEARTEGMRLAIESSSGNRLRLGAGFVFDLLGPDGLVWSKTSEEPATPYDGGPLAPGDYFWSVRSSDPKTILALRELPRLRITRQ